MGSKCVVACSCMSVATWKLACATAWDGLCCAACGDAQTRALHGTIGQLTETKI